MDACPEPLEKLFQKVEEESERRAQEDVDNERVEVTDSELIQNSKVPAVNPTTNRRRGSISITRFGQLAEESLKVSQGPPTPTLSAIASRSAYYQVSSNESTKSFASGASLDDERAHVEDNHRVTQMLHIAGRQSISKAVGSLLPRRLSRARSSNIVLEDANVVIGVSVEEATVESAEDAEAYHVVVHAPAILRNRTSRLSMAGSSPARSDWIARAKALAHKFRRKAQAMEGTS